jgi:hypothetical protein
VAFAGTSFTLRHAKVLQSLTGRRNPFRIRTDFGYHTRQTAWNYLNTRLDLSECESVYNDPVSMASIEGRPRLASRVIDLLDDTSRTGTKSEVLKAAIRDSFELHLETTFKRAYDKLKSDKSSIIIRTLEVVALAASMYTKIAIQVPNGEERGESNYTDLLESGICHLKRVKREG